MVRNRGHASFLKPDIAIDLGTAWVRVAYGASGLYAVPSTLDGRAALKGGVVVDPSVAALVLSPLLNRVRRFGVVPPRAVACIPSDASERERDAVRDCVMKAGAADVFLVPEPLAAAIGAGVDVASPFADMILDVGEGVTDCAVIRSGRIAARLADRVGCADLRRAAMKVGSRVLKRSFGREEAERLLRAAGLGGNEGLPEASGLLVNNRGRVDSGFWEIYREAVDPLAGRIIGVAVAMLRRIEPFLGCEIIENGIWLTGGGSLLEGMKERLGDATGIRVNDSCQPLEAVARGAHAMLPVVSRLNIWRN